MSELDVLHYPDSVLRKPCDPVSEIDAATAGLAERMADIMYDSNGIGLAAPQVGQAIQLITVDVGEGLITLLNPRIEQVEGEDQMDEGCLCFPGITVPSIKRAVCARVRGVDLLGREVVLDAEGLLARCLQHEIDHLQGRLIIDHVSKIKRDLLLRQYRKAQEKEEHA